MKALLYSIWLWVISDPERLALAGLALAVGTWKALPLALRVSLEKRFPRAIGGLRVIVKLAPDVIGALRVGWHQALKARPRATIEAGPQEPASPSSSEPGFAERGILAVIAGVALLALGITLLTGCPMPAADGCSPGSRRCHEDTPQVCSPGQRWTPADVTCSTVNATCIVRDGVPACLRGEQ